MTRPVRLQLSRSKGFDLQAVSQATNGLPAVNTARPSRWGNPFRIVRRGARVWAVERDGETFMTANTLQAAQSAAVALFRAYYGADDFSALRGKNLACWCKPGDPCHADILLTLANGFGCKEAG